VDIKSEFVYPVIRIVFVKVQRAKKNPYASNRVDEEKRENRKNQETFFGNAKLDFTFYIFSP